MEKSERYVLLENRIREIETRFSFVQDSTNPPTEEQEDKIRAMIVLCHAEFEDYIEQLAIDLAKRGRERWNREKIANKNISSLFLFSEKYVKGLNNHEMTIEAYSNKVISDFINYIERNNHGIKRNNLEDIYEPLGYNMDSFSQQF